jgi:hypothetical protein
MASEKRLIDLVGQRFGKLVVSEYAGRNERRESLWRCACDCGNESIVRGDVLRRGTTESCGCGKGLKHGYHKKPWYSSYKAMMERCYLPSSANYQRYGGKGVTVCEEWHNINKFAEWVETSGYAPGLTIDRIDPLGNYEPSNCQWLTRSENSKKQFEDRKKRTKQMVEVVHGRWNVLHFMTEPWQPSLPDKYVCSECLNITWSKHNYCPNCGAKMDGDGNEAV